MYCVFFSRFFLMYMFRNYFIDVLGVPKTAKSNRMIKLLSYLRFCDFPCFSTEIPDSAAPLPTCPDWDNQKCLKRPWPQGDYNAMEIRL